MDNWLTTLKNAKKTCIQHGNLRKVHYALGGGKEMVEEYNMATGVVTRRVWKVKTDLGTEGEWLVELGDPEPTSLSTRELVIKENATQPFVSRRVTKNALEWRIRNLPYSVETYSITADAKSNTLVVRTSNKKYYKILKITDLERLNLVADQSKVEFTHKFNTLIITYKKPQEMLDFEKAIFEDVKALKTRSESDVDCKPS